MRTRNRSSHRAFTLVEILIVLVIVVLLSALGFYGAKVAITKSREARCLSNLHQMGVVMGTYAADNNGVLPFESHDVSPFRWYLALLPYLGRAEDDWSTMSVFICPAHDPHTGDANGGRYKLWLDFGYASNIGLLSRRISGADGGYSYWPNPPTRLCNIPERHVLVGDVGVDRGQYLKSTDNGLPYGTVANARVHRHGVNLLWTDFSASWRLAEDIVNKKGVISCWWK